MFINRKMLLVMFVVLVFVFLGCLSDDDKNEVVLDLVVLLVIEIVLFDIIVIE